MKHKVRWPFILVIVLALSVTGCGKTESVPAQEVSKEESLAEVSEETSDTKPEEETQEAVATEEESGLIPVLVIEANGKIFYAALEDNSSAEALIERLHSEPVTIAMHDYGSFEKVGDLPWSLPTNDEQITTGPGDVILYQGDKITVYYAENTWSFTRLARIDSATKDELLDAFGDDDVEMTFSLEWR